MNEYTAITVTILGIFLSIAIGTGISELAKVSTDVEAVKAGLQQCKVGYQVLWKKECKDER